MADELTFKLKIMKSLYGFGLKNLGETLLLELKKGGPEWMSFAQELLNGEDYPRRKIVLKQLTGRGFVEKSKKRDQLVGMLTEFLASKNALGEEKKTALKFVTANLHLFPTDDDLFRSKILALQRERDSSLSQAATDLLPKIGINMDDPDLYRSH